MLSTTVNIFIVPVVRFQQSMYTVIENEGLQSVLVLAGIASIDVTVQVFTTKGSTTGKH